jgi:hypothetical protein
MSQLNYFLLGEHRNPNVAHDGSSSGQTEMGSKTVPSCATTHASQ